jgi:hypothetical protein
MPSSRVTRRARWHRSSSERALDSCVRSSDLESILESGAIFDSVLLLAEASNYGIRACMSLCARKHIIIWGSASCNVILLLQTLSPRIHVLSPSRVVDRLAIPNIVFASRSRTESTMFCPKYVLRGFVHHVTRRRLSVGNRSMSSILRRFGLPSSHLERFSLSTFFGTSSP